MDAPDPKKIKQLRDRTALPVLECRRAIIEAKGDIEAAVKLLYKWHPIPAMDTDRR